MVVNVIIPVPLFKVTPKLKNNFYDDKNNNTDK